MNPEILGLTDVSVYYRLAYRLQGTVFVLGEGFFCGRRLARFRTAAVGGGSGWLARVFIGSGGLAAGGGPVRSDGDHFGVYNAVSGRFSVDGLRVDFFRRPEVDSPVCAAGNHVGRAHESRTLHAEAQLAWGGRVDVIEF